jgi:hypothetical protein
MKLSQRSNQWVRLPVMRSAPSGDVGLLLFTPRGNRQPRRTPPEVDNLWEWARPRQFPSRRSSAFGSPTAELAREFGPPGGVICQIFVRMPFRLAQLIDCPDARYHPDVENLPPLVQELDKTHPSIHDALATPVADSKFLDKALVRLNDESTAVLRNHITLWRTSRLVREGQLQVPDSTGECFFEAPGGYQLIAIES